MSSTDARDPEQVATWSELEDREPAHARAEGVDLVIIRYDDQVSVLYGRCLHRGVPLGDGSVEGKDLICGVHGWDYRYDTGVSEYDNSEVLEKFTVWIAESLGANRAYVVGGAGIYELFQPAVDRMALSRVPGEYEGDTSFLEWDETECTLLASTDYDGFTLEEWVRNSDGGS